MKKLLVLLVVAMACLSLPASATCSNAGTYYVWGQTNGTEASSFIPVQGTCTFKPINLSATMVNNGLANSTADLIEVEEANSCTNLLGVLLFQDWLGVTNVNGNSFHVNDQFPGTVGNLITTSVCVHFGSGQTNLLESFEFSYALQ